MIKKPYTLFIRIPLFQGPDGKYYTFDIWKKDLLLHFSYIQSLKICCPVIKKEVIEPDLVPIHNLFPSQVYVIKADGGWVSVFLNFFPNWFTITKAVMRSEIVHSDGSGWAFPLSYYILPLRFFKKFKWIMIIEATFWMAPKGTRRGLRKRTTEFIHTFLTRSCVKRADATIFTQEWYREYFRGQKGRALVTPASWINYENIRSELRIDREKRDYLRLIFPSRMIPDKGVRLVIEALKIFDKNSEGREVFFDFIGSGSLISEVNAFAETQLNLVRARVLPTIPYDSKFFELLSGYDAVVIASQTEEQPRIIMDSFSQGVPCIASATNGNSSLISHNYNGFLFDPQSPDELAKLILHISKNRELILDLRKNALREAHKHTHAAMHHNREVFLKEVLDLE